MINFVNRIYFKIKINTIIIYNNKVILMIIILLIWKQIRKINLMMILVFLHFVKLKIIKFMNKIIKFWLKILQ